MDNIINELLIQVKANKKYSSISDEIIITEIKNYISKIKLKNKTESKTEKITKQDIKEIRNQLHKSYGSFQTKKKNKVNDYLDELKTKIDNNGNIDETTNKLLSITLSTKERIDDYSALYKLIFDITGKPKIITDIGAGFNIFSFPLMNLSSLTYYSYDINEKDIEYINDYIKIMKSKGLTGKAAILDLRNIRDISHLPFSNIVFMFKLIDLLDKENHKPSEELLTSLFKNKITNFVVVSFATKTLTRRSMNKPNRKWFELMLERNNLNFRKIKTGNELFYIVFQ